MGDIRIRLTDEGWKMWHEERVGRGGVRIVPGTHVNKQRGERAIVEDATFGAFRRSEET